MSLPESERRRITFDKSSIATINNKGLDEREKTSRLYQK
jgi:hypothetical protein